jgi:hypothetical protein
MKLNAFTADRFDDVPPSPTPGRPLIGKCAMTPAGRQQRRIITAAGRFLDRRWELAR